MKEEGVGLREKTFLISGDPEPYQGGVEDGVAKGCGREVEDGLRPRSPEW